jgi:polyphosphate kinase
VGARFFNRELLPVLSPLGLDPAHPFPRILNKSLNFLVSLEGKDAFGRNRCRHRAGAALAAAHHQYPGAYRTARTSSYSCPRSSTPTSTTSFPGMKVTGCYQFRVTRNSDLFVDDEEVEDSCRRSRASCSAALR